MTVLAVSGGRDYQDSDTLFNVMDSVHNIHKLGLVIQGECHKGGADELVRLWAIQRQINCLSVPAKSNRYGWPAAGHKRNEEMAGVQVDSTDEYPFVIIPDYWLLFPGGRGTESAKNIAKLNGIEVLEWHQFVGA